MVAAHASQKHFTTANDNSQQVIEIVSDAAGQTANRFHFVSALNLAFEPLTGLFRTITLGNLLPKNFIGAGELGRSALHSEFEFVVCVLEFLFKALVCTDVPHVKQQGRLAKIFNAARTDRYRNRSAVRRQTEALEFVGTICL